MKAGDPEVGPGFWITNNDGVKGDYFVYENSRDERPWKYITVCLKSKRVILITVFLPLIAHTLKFTCSD
jgi:hypothetical protein